MRNHRPLLALLTIPALLLGCGQGQNPDGTKSDTDPDHVELIQPAPPEVASELVALLDSADERYPGAAVASFEEFLERHHGYETDRLARSEIDHYRSLSIGRYRHARQIARDGRFEDAEAILLDLAHYLPDSEDGERAQGHLEYDFYLNQAQHYLVRQRFKEAERVARALLQKDLTPSQAEPIEQILDSVGHVGAALGQAERASMMSACRQLMMMLAQTFVEEGSYPSELSIRTIEEWDPMMGRSILRTISSIENYRASDGLYSFTAVGSSGGNRIEVVDCEIQDTRSR
jgi:hypothetical protein